MQDLVHELLFSPAHVKDRFGHRLGMNQRHIKLEMRNSNVKGGCVQTRYLWDLFVLEIFHKATYWNFSNFKN